MRKKLIVTTRQGRCGEENWKLRGGKAKDELFIDIYVGEWVDTQRLVNRQF